MIAVAIQRLTFATRSEAGLAQYDPGAHTILGFRYTMMNPRPKAQRDDHEIGLIRRERRQIPDPRTADPEREEHER